MEALYVLDPVQSGGFATPLFWGESPPVSSCFSFSSHFAGTYPLVAPQETVPGNHLGPYKSLSPSLTDNLETES